MVYNNGIRYQQHSLMGPEYGHGHQVGCVRGVGTRLGSLSLLVGSLGGGCIRVVKWNDYLGREANKSLQATQLCGWRGWIAADRSSQSMAHRQAAGYVQFRWHDGAEAARAFGALRSRRRAEVQKFKSAGGVGRPAPKSGGGVIWRDSASQNSVVDANRFQSALVDVAGPDFEITSGSRRGASDRDAHRARPRRGEEDA